MIHFDGNDNNERSWALTATAITKAVPAFAQTIERQKKGISGQFRPDLQSDMNGSLRPLPNDLTGL